MKSYPFLAAWSFLAGAGIPLIGVLNSGVSRSVGNPLAATAILFLVAFMSASGLSLAVHGAPALGAIAAAPEGGYLAGLLIGFHALSATALIPRFDAGDFIAPTLLAQIVTSALLDQFGPLGSTGVPWTRTGRWASRSRSPASSSLRWPPCGTTGLRTGGFTDG